MRLSQITESLQDITPDVDYIYEIGFKPFYEKLKQYDITSAFEFIDDETIIDSKDLVSKSAQLAHQSNPTTIICNNHIGNNYNSKKHIISLNIKPTILDVIHRLHSRHDNVKDLMKGIVQRYNIEYSTVIDWFSPTLIKSTIRHELAHWIDNSTSGHHLTNKVNSFTGNSDIDFARHHDKDVDSMFFTYQEIEGIIHELVEYRRAYTQQEWDSMTLNDLAQHAFPQLGKAIKYDKNTRGFDKFMKRFLHRMNREGLLGKNMRKGFIQ